MCSQLVITVDEAFINRAAIILNDLWDEVCLDENAYTTCKISGAVDFVLSSRTKTWPYILMTQLLGKATDGRVNILSMHKASGLDGAWDARSLCEHVISKNDGFEATVLGGILGGVKQPYNNSPGQKPSLSKENKTMKSHIPIRDAIIDGLQTIDGDEDAKRCLGYFLRVCNTTMKEVISDETVPEKANFRPIDLSRFRTFLTKLAEQGRDGEGLSIATALMMSTVFQEKNGYSVVLYPINTSRQRGGEHEDLEVYFGTEKYAAMELKDKPFASSEVSSAAEKAWDSGFARFGFIYGYGAGPVNYETVPESNRKAQRERRTFAACLSIEQLVDSLLFTLGEINYEQIRVSAVRLLENARVKARTQTIARELLRDFISSGDQ